MSKQTLLWLNTNNTLHDKINVYNQELNTCTYNPLYNSIHLYSITYK